MGNVTATKVANTVLAQGPLKGRRVGDVPTAELLAEFDREPPAETKRQIKNELLRRAYYGEREGGDQLAPRAEPPILQFPIATALSPHG
jgi:hypothetical protein